MQEIVIRLEGRTREDGSVFISSPDIHLFSAVGGNEADAIKSAVAIVSKLLQDHWEEVQPLRMPTLRGLGESSRAHLLPAHVIATVAGEKGRIRASGWLGSVSL